MKNTLLTTYIFMEPYVGTYISEESKIMKKIMNIVFKPIVYSILNRVSNQIFKY